MNILNILDDAKKIYIFDPVYDKSAALEQANKKKLSAFGFATKLNLLNKPKDETVHPGRHELRYEPFWCISADRNVVYDLSMERKLEVDNEHAKEVSIDGKKYEIFSDGKKHFSAEEKRFCTLNVQYHCQRNLEYKTYMDGLSRGIKNDFFEKIFKNPNYKYHEVNEVNVENVLALKVSASTVLQQIKNTLLAEKIVSHEIFTDEVIVDKLHVFYRPVYAFEYIWSHENKVGVIEIDGLNGEITEKGEWMKEKITKVITRDMMFEVGSEVANGLVPGSGVVVKILGKMTKN